MKYRLTWTIVFLLISLAAVAQKNKKEKKTAENSKNAPTSLNPYYGAQASPERQSSRKGKSTCPTYNAEQKFFERAKEVEKQRIKNERLSEKPQYSNPMYFGHKRPPKKRPPHKMKLCKECGIRH